MVGFLSYPPEHHFLVSIFIVAVILQYQVAMCFWVPTTCVLVGPFNLKGDQLEEICDLFQGVQLTIKDELP